MKKISRREALKAFGLVAGVPVLTRLNMDPKVLRTAERSFQFVAIGPLPPPPFPAYASLVLRGYASSEGKASGVITGVVASGHPPTEGAPVFLRTSIVASVESVELGKKLEVKARIDDAADLAVVRQASAFDLSIDRDIREVLLNFRGTTFKLDLTEFRGE